jgi:hypothetical protein
LLNEKYKNKFKEVPVHIDKTYFEKKFKNLDLLTGKVKTTIKNAHMNWILCLLRINESMIASGSSDK